MHANKSNIFELVGLLHPLPVPDSYFNSININFIGSLLIDKEYDMPMMIMILYWEMLFCILNDASDSLEQILTREMV